MMERELAGRPARDVPSSAASWIATGLEIEELRSVISVKKFHSIE